MIGNVTHKRKHSRQRDKILEILRGTNTHPTAEWIYMQAKRSLPRLSLGTVYRNLSLLKELGIIDEIRHGNEPSRFDANRQPHSHFICEICHRVYDVDAFPLPTVRLEKKLGCKVSTYRVEFFGICKDCLARQSRMTKSSGKME